MGSDRRICRRLEPKSDFNPRSPCGERPVARSCFRPTGSFQSTLPVWGATVRSWKHRAFRAISIHAPRVGSDRNKLAQWSTCCLYIATATLNLQSPYITRAESGIKLVRTYRAKRDHLMLARTRTQCIPQDHSLDLRHSFLFCTCNCSLGDRA